MPSIMFTGGGTAGHVTPNIPLIKTLRSEGWTVAYIGSKQGPEKTLISRMGIAFHGISSGKLRRYFSWQNFIDPFKVLIAIAQAWRILRREKVDVLFSKGGFVAFPVVFAAWLRRIPVITHESDFSPGLANRLSLPFAKKICLTFDASKKHLSNPERAVVTGTPIREGLDGGIQVTGRELCGFHSQRPIVLVMGGSLGAQHINETVRKALPQLLKRYQVIHLCGKGKVDHALTTEGYAQFEYLDEELADVFAASDMVVSRSGANAVYELMALAKPHILIPLSAKASRGDQVQNAAYFEKLGASVVLNDEDLSASRLLECLYRLEENKAHYSKAMEHLQIHSATEAIIAIIKEQIDHEQPVYS